MRPRRPIAIVIALAAIAAPLLARADGTPGWYAGDLHVHTTYSHDSWDPIADDEDSEPYTLGHSVDNQFRVASARGLDFLLISDHNDIRAHTDPGFGAHGVLGLRGYENSLSGHAQMIGATSCYSPDGPFAPEDGLGGVTGCNGWPDKTAARVRAMADHLRADGGAFQINHPSSDLDDPIHYRDWGMGHDVVPDSVEVWNIQSFWQPPLFSSNSLDDAIEFWEGFLNEGERVAATGGSDNHWVSTTAVQGVGQPTTWVYADDRSEGAIVDAIRAGRTTISWQPPALGGPRLELVADGDGDGTFESMIGDEVPAGSRVRLGVVGAAPGALLEIITNLGRVVVSDPVEVGPEMTLAPGTTWVRAELFLPDHADTAIGEACDDALSLQTTYCRNRFARIAMTSALYVTP